MPNPFVHAELATTNVPKAKAFYGKLFKWKLEDLPFKDGKAPTPAGAYTMINVGDGVGGGMMQQCIPGAPSAWMPYVHVANIKAATKNAKTLKANILKDVTEVEGMGWLSIIEDPTGAVLGLWEPKMK